MVTPILESLNDPTDITTYNKVVKAYQNSILNNIGRRPGQSYTQQYPDILNAFIAFEKTTFNILSAADKAVPTDYAFIVPDPIAVVDYAPGVATWDAAAAQAKSYKCAAFTAAELDTLTRLTGRSNRSADSQKLYERARTNICASKGYYFNDGSFVNKGCEADCGGCCAPSAEELPGPTASSCPKPKVRPFHIPPRQIRLRLVSPSVKAATTECFSNEHARDLQQIYKSQKMLALQGGAATLQ